MPGASQTLKRAADGTDRTVFVEFMRLTASGSGVIYHASPAGRSPSTPFTMIEDGQRLVFENPEHDFPVRIIYERAGADTLAATIEGIQGGQQRRETWNCRRRP